MADLLIYEEGKIRITSNVFTNGHGDQYVIATIKAIRDVHKSKSILPLILGLIFLGASSLHPFFQYGREILAVVGVLFLLWYVTQKERYTVFLTTPAGEVAAFTTRNEQQHKNILGCLKKAIALHHG